MNIHSTHQQHVRCTSAPSYEDADDINLKNLNDLHRRVLQLSRAPQDCGHLTAVFEAADQKPTLASFVVTCRSQGQVRIII